MINKNKKSNAINKLPDFTTMSRQQEAQWWDTHDVTDYLDEFEPVSLRVQLAQPKEDAIMIRLNKGVKEQLAKVARSKGLNVSSLTRMWIMERLQQKAGHRMST